MNHAITNILLGYESFSELRLGIFSELDNHGDFLLKVSHFTAKRFMFPLKKKKKKERNRGQIMQPKWPFSVTISSVVYSYFFLTDY